MIAQDIHRLSTENIDSLCQQYLAILYHDIRRKNTPIEQISESYGEILYPGVDQLLAAIQLSEQDIFVDYGSGLGKIVIQVFLKSLVKEAYGIEILPELHQYAFNAACRIKEELPEFYTNGRKLTFLLGNFLEMPLKNATVALINSTCFTQNLLNELGKIINNTASIHTVLSMRPIASLQRLTFRKTIRIECSWDSALCYLYK